MYTLYHNTHTHNTHTTHTQHTHTIAYLFLSHPYAHTNYVHTHIPHTQINILIRLLTYALSHTPHTHIHTCTALPTTITTTTKAQAAEDARVEREGLAMLPLPLASLYGHSPTLTSTLPQGTRDLREMRVTLEVEECLMSPDQRRDLNPLCITVCQARGIPPLPPPPPPSKTTPLTTTKPINER